MKTLLTLIILAIFGFTGASAGAAPLTSGVDVLVLTNPGNKVAYKGKTDVRGSFSTGKLDEGAYVVQFNSTNAAALKGQQFSIAAVGGKRAVTATAVAGEKFGAGGVAMRVEVAAGSRLTGQVALGEVAAADGVRSASAVPRARDRSSDFLRRNQELSGQGAALPNGVVRPTGR
jgi:hypothetical protein